MADLAPLPSRGRRFVARRRVRFGDADRYGRLRLDATARYLQDVGNDDTRDLGHDPAVAWVVRRTTIATVVPLAVGEMVELTTFCSGIGSRWAERRTSLVGDDGGHVEAASLWVFLDPASGRPARLGPAFIAAYADAAGGRTVTARRHHRRLPERGDRRPWPLRSTDVDLLGHVNNAATWEAVDDELDRRRGRASTAEVEYHAAVEPDDPVELVAATIGDGRLGLWLTVDGGVRASAEVDLVPDEDGRSRSST